MEYKSYSLIYITVENQEQSISSHRDHWSQTGLPLPSKQGTNKLSKQKIKLERNMHICEKISRKKMTEKKMVLGIWIWQAPNQLALIPHYLTRIYLLFERWFHSHSHCRYSPTSLSDNPCLSLSIFNPFSHSFYSLLFTSTFNLFHHLNQQLV